MDRQRRLFLGCTLKAGSVAIAVASGLLSPALVLAKWPEQAFSETKVDTAMNALLGASDFQESKDIKIKAPDIAEDGAVVPVSVSTKIEAVESISIYAFENVRPLAVSADLGANARPTVSTRIKLGKTSQILAIVKSQGKLYGASKTVKVTLGGCGG